MPVTVTGLVGVDTMLFEIDTTAKKRVRQALIQRAHAIRKTARKMAPRDEGFLEQAIEVRGDVMKARDTKGRFTYVPVEVYIDMELPLEHRADKTVGDYAYFVHEQLEPRGPWELGDASKAKQQQHPDVQVGGGFLDRAAEAESTALDAALLDIVRNL